MKERLINLFLVQFPGNDWWVFFLCVWAVTQSKVSFNYLSFTLTFDRLQTCASNLMTRSASFISHTLLRFEAEWFGRCCLRNWNIKFIPCDSDSSLCPLLVTWMSFRDTSFADTTVRSSKSVGGSCWPITCQAIWMVNPCLESDWRLWSSAELMPIRW